MLTEAISYLTLPMSCGLALTADDLVLFALGDKWTAVILPLQILCLYMALNTTQVLLAHILMWTGRFQAIMWLTLFATAILPLGFYLGIPFGLEGVSWGWVIGFPISVVPAFVLVFRSLDLSWRKFLETLRPALTGCLLMAGVVLSIRMFLPETRPPAFRLAVEVLLGAATYTAVMMTLFRTRVFDLYHIVQESRSPHRT